MENHLPPSTEPRLPSEADEDADAEMSSCSGVESLDLEGNAAGGGSQTGSRKVSFAFSDVMGSDDSDMEIPALSERDAETTEAVQNLIKKYTLGGTVSINDTGEEVKHAAAVPDEDQESDVDSNLTDAEDMIAADSDVGEEFEDEEINLPSTSHAAYFATNSSHTVSISMSEKDAEAERRYSEELVGLEEFLSETEEEFPLDQNHLTTPELVIDPTTDDEVLDEIGGRRIKPEDMSDDGLTDVEDISNTEGEFMAMMQEAQEGLQAANIELPFDEGSSITVVNTETPITANQPGCGCTLAHLSDVEEGVEPPNPKF